jgi:hypothetical protein
MKWSIAALILWLAFATRSNPTAAEDLPISLGPFDPSIVMANQKKSGGGFERNVKSQEALLAFLPENVKLPKAESCVRCHNNGIFWDGSEDVQIGSLQKGASVRPYLTNNAWVHESAISVAIVGRKNASEVNLRLPWARVLWVRSAGIFIDKSRFFERSSITKFGITNFASGKTIEVFYRSTTACPEIKNEFKKYDGTLLRNGSH